MAPEALAIAYPTPAMLCQRRNSTQNTSSQSQEYPRRSLDDPSCHGQEYRNLYQAPKAKESRSIDIHSAESVNMEIQSSLDGHLGTKLVDCRRAKSTNGHTPKSVDIGILILPTNLQALDRPAFTVMRFPFANELSSRYFPDTCLVGV